MLGRSARSRSWYSAPLAEFLSKPNVLDELCGASTFEVKTEQRDAWSVQLDVLRECLGGLGEGHLFLEFQVPRLGGRADAVLVCGGLVFVMEFKVGARRHELSAVDQCVDYALDLKNFHDGSHEARLVPVLVATGASGPGNAADVRDGVSDVVKASAKNARDLIVRAIGEWGGGARGGVAHWSVDGRVSGWLDAEAWAASDYHPTPTIIEAARAFYRGHDVREINRSGAGIANLTKTADAIGKIVRESKSRGQKSICFVTGVPGAGKTLAGLNLAHQNPDGAQAVFLSGNGPLVKVLHGALVRDWQERNRGAKRDESKHARQRVKAMIQNIHHFRDEYAVNSPGSAPPEKVVIFDEAQRAWTRKKLSDFMTRKKGVRGFGESEPESLLGAMNRHDGWAVVVCLVGGGQEINDGEAGISEWFAAIRSNHPDWRVYLSDRMLDREYDTENLACQLFRLDRGAKRARPAPPCRLGFFNTPALHLDTCIRSFKSSHMSSFVKALLEHRAEDARASLVRMLAPDPSRGGKETYPVAVTRDFACAKAWLRTNAAGSQRFGVVASAKSCRLRPHGIYVELKLTNNIVHWFLNGKDDPRASYSMEYVATEFDVQGLELDWACVAWDADLVHDSGEWTHRSFKGSKWQRIRKRENQRYLENAYRVLLTRARQGLVIFVPPGEDGDLTRNPACYDQIFRYLRGLGIPEI